MEQNHTTQRPNRDQYLPPKEENTESTMKRWFYEQRLRQMENENVSINARLDKLEMLGSISQQNQNSTSHTRRRRNRNRTKKNVNGPSVYTENIASDQSGSESDNRQSNNTVDPSVRGSSSRCSARPTNNNIDNIRNMSFLRMGTPPPLNPPWTANMNLITQMNQQMPHVQQIHAPINTLPHTTSKAFIQTNYLEKIAKRSDVIVIQEHWLHSFENHELQEFLTDFNCFVKCSDDNEPIAPYQCPRGKGGVALCYKTAIVVRLLRKSKMEETVLQL